MKLKKSIKFLAAGLGVIAPIGFGLNLVSCGHKEGPKNPDGWKNFKSLAVNEHAINIVKTTHPNGWDDATPTQLSQPFNIHLSDNPYIVSLEIRRTIDKNKGSYIAEFNIEYFNNQKYDVSNWVCKHEPQFIPSAWTYFKNAATKATATEILEQIHPWTDTNKFQWKFGTPSQVAWAATDKAEFDTFGGGPDPDEVFKGMNGKPVDNESDETITAIISKKGKNGAYDSDPIKVVLTFTQDETYNVDDWSSGIATAAAQLQSYSRFMTFWDRVEDSIKKGDVGDFMGQYWMTIRSDEEHHTTVDTKGNAQSPDYHIYDALSSAGYAGDAAPKPGTLKFKDKSAYAPTKENNYKCGLIITFKANHNALDILELSFTYNLVNGNLDDGGTAFNYIWTGYAHPQTQHNH